MEVKAQVRKAQGTGASRRLRRAGKTPGILYGGDEPAVAIELDHNELFQHLRKEAFHASILSLNVEGKKQPVLLRTYTMHPFRREVQHIDFQRVAADQKVRMEVPLHFMNQENNDAVKLGGAKITHVLTELEVRCLPSALPEYIEVDLTHIPVNGTIHAQDIKLPEGVELANRGENPAVAIANVPRGAGEEGEAAAPEAAAAAAPAEEEKK
ncbi:MAG TPA: 50S ribosomal protein L25/general stress protein Ctc [Burkholderiales bacterium]|nr:50S ribosomal protein L25/general stress protein Ctc [Burkholderiales bacterium]